VTRLGRPTRPAQPGAAADPVRWEQRYLKWLYYAGAGGLAPWIVYLYYSQARRGVTHEVHLLAVGLLLAMLAGLAATAWLCARDRAPAVLAASFTATVTFITAWFRTLTHAARANWSDSRPAFLIIAAAIIGLCLIAIRRQLAAGRPPPGGPAGTGIRAHWLAAALVVAALALIPSLVIAAAVVPPVQVSHHLRLAWTGLDVCEFLALAATGLALDRRWAATTVPATITGALLLCDAWINIIPTRGTAHAEAVILAFVEVPMAALSFWIAARAVRRPARAARPGS
jgi:hypothetical protein